MTIKTMTDFAFLHAGEQDNILPVAWQERFAERFRANRMVRPDAGHQVMNTRPQALAKVLLAEAAA